MALFAYMQRVQRMLADQKAEQFNPFDLVEYINQARERVAFESQSLRILPASSGSFATLTVGAGGTGYTSAPTVTISAPDAYSVGWIQATATATVGGGAVTGLTITNPGTGYVNPTVTFSGGGGSGATANFTLTPFIKTTLNQEIYTFAQFNAVAQQTAGVSAICAVQTVSVSWGSQKPTLRNIDWSGFQAYCRSINLASTNWPAIWAQYGQGVGGSIYLFPIPAQTNQMDWDCYCLPIDLVDDSTVEILYKPWTQAVPYYACYLAYLSLKDRDNATFYLAAYKQRMMEARAWATPVMLPDFYMGL